MRPGEVQMQAPPEVTSGDGEQPRARSLRLFHGCIGAVVLGVFVTVVLPLLVWAAGILLAGSR